MSTMQEADYGTYMCYATNSMGSVQRLLEVSAEENRVGKESGKETVESEVQKQLQRSIRLKEGEGGSAQLMLSGISRGPLTGTGKHCFCFSRELKVKCKLSATKAAVKGKGLQKTKTLHFTYVSGHKTAMTKLSWRTWSALRDR